MLVEGDVGMSKRPFRLKESFYSFLGGVVASIASTIIYEAIDSIGSNSSSLLSYVLLWISGLLMCGSCVFLLMVSSYIGNIEAKYNAMIDYNKDPDEIWFRSIRALSESKILPKNRGESTQTIDRLIEEDANKTYWRIVRFLIYGSSAFLVAIIILVISKVV